MNRLTKSFLSASKVFALLLAYLSFVAAVTYWLGSLAMVVLVCILSFSVLWYAIYESGDL